MKMAAVAVVGPRRRLGPTICQADIFKAAKNPRSSPLDAERKTQLQTRRGGFARPKARLVLSKIAPCQSFPRKRESTFLWTDVDPRLRGVTTTAIFISLGGPQAHVRSG
jgi:hypothetical protein